MSTYGNGNSFGGGSFYSEPHPENVGNKVEREDFANVHEAHSATPPPYTDYAPQDDGSFAPAAMVNQDVREEMEPGAVIGPPMPTLPLIAAGLFTLWLIFREGK